jgi:DNA-directed RNA polymerase specialized sigma subunit
MTNPKKLTAAQKKNVESCLRLSDSVANYVHSVCPSVDLQELKLEAKLQLCIAATKFDPSKGFQFTTLAFHCIRSKLFTKAKKEIRSQQLGGFEFDDLLQGNSHDLELLLDAQALIDVRGKKLRRKDIRKLLVKESN